MENKIQIINEIIKRHPAYGVTRGWSQYTGGMVDSGHWYFRKMLDVPYEELLSFLDDIIKEENEPLKVYTSEELSDMSILHPLPNGGFINEYERKIMDSFSKNLEQDIFNLKAK